MAITVDAGTAAKACLHTHEPREIRENGQYYNAVVLALMRQGAKLTWNAGLGTALIVDTIFTAGRIQGVREERAKRRKAKR